MKAFCFIRCSKRIKCIKGLFGDSYPYETDMYKIDLFQMTLFEIDSVELGYLIMD